MKTLKTIVNALLIAATPAIITLLIWLFSFCTFNILEAAREPILPVLSGFACIFGLIYLLTNQILNQN